MSGQDIIIEQLRAEVERLRDDRADLQERCNRLTGERNTALLMMKDEEARAEKAERFIATADSEWKARAEKAEDERDEARAEREREERLEALGRAIVEASRFFQDADDIALSEDVTIWEDDCHGGDHRTVLIMDDNQHALLADVSEAVATYREETAGVDVRSDEIKELRKRAEKAERERDEARANFAFMVKRAADQKLDGYRELGARAAAAEERAEKAERERDARPDISAEDARAFMMFKPVPARDSREGPVMHALRAHAAKVKP